jgi:hypothetical protein
MDPSEMDEEGDINGENEDTDDENMGADDTI